MYDVKLDKNCRPPSWNCRSMSSLYTKNQKYLHLPIAFFLRFCYNDQVLAMWGISTVGRTSLQLFIPAGGSRRKAVSVRSAQNSTRKFGALAQLVARDIRIVEVRSSNLLCSTIYDEIRTLLHLRKRDVRMHLPKRRWAERSGVKTPDLFVFIQKKGAK